MNKKFFDLELNEEISDFYKKTIYTLHYPGEKGISVSYGILDEIFLDKKYEFKHFCTTDRGSSGSPILDIQENKIIGVHKAAKGNAYNLGTFINCPVKEFIEENYIDNKMIEFSKKFNLNIKSNITKLKLNREKAECINYLQNLALNELKELDISYCGITDISFLEKVKFKKLEKLNLGSNKITNFNVLENANFNELKELIVSS